MRCALSLVALTLVAACNQSDRLTGSDKAGNKSDKNAKEESSSTDTLVDGDDDENTLADIPAQVSGAFLTCDAAPDFQPAEAGASPRGCALRRDDAKIKDGVRDIAISLTTKDGSVLTPETQVAPDASPWHVFFAIPAGQRSNIARLDLDLTVDDHRLSFSKSVDGDTLGIRIAVDPDARVGDDVVVKLDNRPLTSGTASEEGPSGAADGSEAMPDATTDTTTDTATDTATASASGGGPLTAPLLFVTKQQFKVSGDTASDAFWGLASADVRCAQAAAAASLGTGTWIALLSGDVPLVDRVPALTSMIQNYKHQDVVDPTDFFGPLLNQLFHEDGTTIEAGAAIWTGSNQSGAAAARCFPSWQPNPPNGQVGRIGQIDNLVDWLDAGTDQLCDSQAHLYCLGYP